MTGMTMRTWLLTMASLSAGCEPPTLAGGLTPYEFSGATRTPATLTTRQARDAAELGLHAGETIRTMSTYQLPGIGQSTVQAVVEDGEHTRAYVIDEDGLILPPHELWARERVARQQRYGGMLPELFEAQAGLSAADLVEVDIMVYADVPEPERPFDGTDLAVPIEAFEAWTRQHSTAQQQRIAAAKSRVLALLAAHGASVTQNPRGLPTIRAIVPVELLRSAELHADDVVRIDPVSHEVPALLGHAGRSSMNASEASVGLVVVGCAARRATAV